MGEIYTRVLSPLGVDASPETWTGLFSEVWTALGTEVGPGRDRYSAYGSERAFWRLYVERVLGRVDAADRTEQATDLLHRTFADPSSWAVFPDVDAALDRLTRAGIPCGVISNWDSRLPALLQGLGLGRLAPVVWSSAVGEEKPSQAIFRTALERAGVPAGACLHVGDDLAADFEGAEAAGMTGVLLDRRGGPASPGVRTIGSLSELPEMVSGPVGAAS